jgi:hypothetical protein
MPMNSYSFENCEIRYDPETHKIETHFRGGAVAYAEPRYREKDLDWAKSKGYDTVEAYTLDHEIGHTLISKLLGFPYSLTLWYAAHNPKGKEDGWWSNWWKEEATVNDFQQWMHEPGFYSPWLWSVELACLKLGVGFTPIGIEWTRIRNTLLTGTPAYDRELMLFK